MLQRNQIPPSLDLRNRPAELPSLAETFDAFISYLLRQYWIILGTAALCLFGGICYLMTAAPRLYRAGDDDHRHAQIPGHAATIAGQ